MHWIAWVWLVCAAYCLIKAAREPDGEKYPDAPWLVMSAFLPPICILYVIFDITHNIRKVFDI